MPEVPIENLQAFTARPLAGPGYLNGDTMNLNTAKGYFYPDRGYAIDSRVAAAADLNNAGGSWLHKHSDGTGWVWKYVDDEVYRHDDTSLIGSLTEKFAPATFNMGSPAGVSGFFNGVNGDALIIRENTGGTELVAVALDSMVVPATVHTTATSGGSIADATYQIRTGWLDQDGELIVRTAPSAVQALVTSGGGTSTITFVEPGSAPDRATHWLPAMTAAGATDTPSNFLLYAAAYAKGSSDQTITALPTTNTEQAFNDVNGTYVQATLPLTGVDSCCLHEGRVFIAATTSNKVYFSLRDEPNHFLTTNEATSGAETGWNSPVLGLCSANGQVYVFTSDSIHVIYGDFTRDDQGTNPTFRIRMGTDVIDQNFGGVGHAAIGTIGPVVYFWSTRGPAAIRGGSAGLVMEDDIEDFVNRSLDHTYLDRIVFSEDNETHAACWLVPRRVNATRAMDGASTAGICDRIVRYDPAHQRWMAPLWPGECVWIGVRKNPATGGTATNPLFFMGMGAHMGTIKEFNRGHSGGGADNVTGTDYDGKLASAETTTSVTVAITGVSADGWIGRTIALKYHADDTGFPSVLVYKEISDNSATSGGSATFNWQGALTVSTGTRWTARLAGWDSPVDWRGDLRQYVEDLPPDKTVQLHEIELRPRDVVGTEAVG